MPEEIKELLKYEHKLTDEEKDRYKNEWIKLVNENSEIRLFQNDKIISTNYDYLDINEGYVILNNRYLNQEINNDCIRDIYHSITESHEKQHR